MRIGPQWNSHDRGDVMIAPATTIRNAGHAFDRIDVSVNRQGITAAHRHFGGGVWAGCGVTIVKDVAIRNGEKFAAVAVAIKGVENFGGADGEVVRRIRSRKPPLEAWK